MHRNVIEAILGTLLCTSVGMAQEKGGKEAAPEEAPVTLEAVPPPSDFKAQDAPYDAGGLIALSWTSLPGEYKGREYVIQVAQAKDGSFKEIVRFPANTGFEADKKWPFWAWRAAKDVHYVEVTPAQAFSPQTGKRVDELSAELDAVKTSLEAEKDEQKIEQLSVRKKHLEKELRDWSRKLKEETEAAQAATYFFRLGIAEGEEMHLFEAVTNAAARGNLFNLLKLNVLLLMVLLGGVILYFIGLARKKELFLRRIPGLEAVDQAIGRATEMGKPVYYLTGSNGMSSISTIAAVQILGEIAKKAARFQTDLKVPHRDPVVLAVCQEVTKQSFTEAGRPDAFREEMNFFITEDQFSYTASVDGMMVREKPAACFYMGYYYAESLLLAEAGASVGAIQIAGTDAEHQLPFFVTACDFTLIGEELFAASAYLSGEPVLVGTLRGQDFAKAAIMAVLVVGMLLRSVGTPLSWEWTETVLEIIKAY